LIGGNLDQVAVGVAAIDRTQRAARALSGNRALLDRHAARLEMRHHLIRGASGEKAKIVAADGFMVHREPFDLVGIAWTHIDLLLAEDKRCPRRLARA